MVPRIVSSPGIRAHFRVLAIVSLIALAGCPQPDPPGDAPKNVNVGPGDGRVTVSWDQEPDLTYWIFFRAGSSVDPQGSGVAVIRDVVSPRVIPGLANGTQYAFVMNATKGDSAAGPNSPIVVATPRLAGVNWASGAALGAANLNGMAFNGARFVAVGDSAAIFTGDHSYTSIDPPGVTAWVPILPASLPPGFTANLSAVTHSSLFVALGTDGSILTSSDGLTWTLATNMVPSAGMNGIAFGLGLYVAVGNGGNIFTSPDLVTWIPATSNTVNHLYSVSLHNGGLVATGANGTLLTSTDAVTWTPQVSNTASALRSVAFSAAVRYVAVGDAGTIVTSADGVIWAPIAPVTAQNLRSVVSGSRFVAVGQGGAVIFSDDGTTWTLTSAGSADLAHVLFAPAMYIAVGAAGANAVSK